MAISRPQESFRPRERQEQPDPSQRLRDEWLEPRTKMPHRVAHETTPKDREAAPDSPTALKISKGQGPYQALEEWNKTLNVNEKLTQKELVTLARRLRDDHDSWKKYGHFKVNDELKVTPDMLKEIKATRRSAAPDGAPPSTTRPDGTPSPGTHTDGAPPHGKHPDGARVGIGNGRWLSAAAGAAIHAAQEGARAMGLTISINSAGRTHEKQWELYRELKPRGAAVAYPGTSKHESGLAIDVQNWRDPRIRRILAQNGFQWGNGKGGGPIPNDEVHFTYTGRARTS